MNNCKASPRISRLVLPAALAALGCPGPQPISIERPIGAVGVQLKLGDVRVQEIAYTITQAGAVYRTGRFAIDGEGSSFSAVIGAMPAHAGYAITLVAMATRADTGTSTDCKGAGAFEIVAGQTTVVAVPIRCAGLGAERGAEPDECARIDAIGAVPGEAWVGKRVRLHCDASQRSHHRRPVRYRWKADRGLVGDALSALASFQCTQPGIATIELTVSDDDNTSCREESISVYVYCRAAQVVSEPGAGGAAGASQPGTAGTAGTSSCGPGGTSGSAAGQSGAAGAAGNLSGSSAGANGSNNCAGSLGSLRVPARTTETESPSTEPPLAQAGA